MNTDDAVLPELTRRQEEILAYIVRAYTQTPEPVSSKFLAETYQLSVSSATIRNEMAALEELGYISQPHTSAGRVPTEIGYRYFVKRLLNAADLTTAEQERITERLHSLPLVTEQWMRVAATLLARTVQTAALVTSPAADTSRFKHLELINIQGRLVLMVLVLHGGSVHQQMLTLADSVVQPKLSEIAVLLNSLCLDLTANEVRMKGTQLQVLEREIVELIADLMDRADGSGAHLVYRDGLGDMIGAFGSNEGAQQAVRIFEERSFLNMILTDILTPFVSDVQVVIAGDGRWEELRHLSMVLSRYGIPGRVSGAVGVLGPTHINYGRAISAVSHVADVMTNMIVTAYEPPASDDEAE